MYVLCVVQNRVVPQTDVYEMEAEQSNQSRWVALASQSLLVV